MLVVVSAVAGCNGIVKGSVHDVLSLILLLLFTSFPPSQLDSPTEPGPESIPCPWKELSAAAVVVSSMASLAKSASRDSMN